MNPRRLAKKLIPQSLFPALEPYGHLAEAVAYNTLNGFPAKGLKVIGVTGTNGKTTTCYLIHRMLREAGYKVGLMTTVAYGANDDIRPQVHHMTNVGVPELMKRLKWLKEQGIEWLVLETTSHALAQHRVWGVPYSLAVFTNLTHEHLDYHKTFERYRDAKRLLFKMTAANKQGLRTGIINADDPSARYFIQDVPQSITYGIQGGQLQATRSKSTPQGTKFIADFSLPEDANTPGITLGGGRDIVPNRVTRSLQLQVNIPGEFNVSNALAAAATGIAIGLTDQQIERGIAALKGVEGRMTVIDEGQDFSVIVDFAHTPDSFEKLFKDLRPVVKGKLIVMFGSAGRRDETKRAVQGALAGKFADLVVITEEDDRDIDGLAIMDQIATGVTDAGKRIDKDLFLVHDRVQAINYAISLAKKGDTVLLLGKGHEKTIERVNGENNWDEIGTARAALRKNK